MDSTPPRFRINVSQTAKGLHQFEATVEMPADSDETGHIGERLLDMLKKTEASFRKDGRKLVIDE